nr:hypothetical protein [Chloroflexota bacterium]
MALYPIYTTRGEHVAFYENGYIFSPIGEWIGFADPASGNVFAIDGEHVGYFARDGRILRKRATEELVPRRTPPPPPPRPSLPATVPLPPMFSELTYDTIDVLDEQPERMHTADIGELRPDMD